MILTLILICLLASGCKRDQVIPSIRMGDITYCSGKTANGGEYFWPPRKDGKCYENDRLRLLYALPSSPRAGDIAAGWEPGQTVMYDGEKWIELQKPKRMEKIGKETVH